MSGIIEATNLQTANIKSTSGNTAITVDANGNTTVGGTATFSNPPVNVGVSNLQYFAVDGNVSITTSDATITSYRDGHDTENFKRIGTAWTVSNGVFTPTVSGMYEINFIASISATADTRYIMIMFKLSTNSGSNYSSEEDYTHLPYLQNSGTHTRVNFIRYYNIPNPSATRLKITTSANTSSVTLRGSGITNRKSGLLIKRIADAQ